MTDSHRAGGGPASGQFRSAVIGGRLLVSEFQRAFRLIDGKVRVERVTTAHQRADVERVRHEIYCVEKGFLREGELLDEYDDDGALFVAYEGDEPIGTVRVTDSSKCTLEIFAMHPELGERVRAGGRYLEVSRLMVRRAYRGLHATMPLFRQVYAELAATRADGLILSGAGKLTSYYRRLMGFRLLSPRPLVHQKLRGLEDYAMIFDVPQSFQNPTPLKLAVWMSIHPTCFWQGMRASLPFGNDDEERT